MFIHFNVKTGRFKVLTVPGFDKCKYPNCVVVQVTPLSRSSAVRVKRNSLVGGRLRILPLVEYNPKKFKSPSEAFRYVLKSKKHRKELERLIKFQFCVETNGETAKKELEEFMRENNVIRFKKGASLDWRVIVTPSGLVIAYPRAYTRGYAIGEVLYDEYTSNGIKELIKKASKELERERKLRVIIYGDGEVFFRGKYLKVCYKKSATPGVRIDPKKGVVVIRGRTVTEAKKKFEEYIHRELLKDIKPVVDKISKAYNLSGRVFLTDKVPKPSTSNGLRFRPLGQTLMKRETDGDKFYLMFSPNLYLLEDWKRIHVVAHELAHVIVFTRGSFWTNYNAHDGNFYKTLEEILKKLFPGVYEKELKTTGGKWIRNAYEENELLGHNKFLNENIRSLKPLKDC